ncbi:MAG: hypothetical protein RR473_13875 [Comamonas sp.]
MARINASPGIYRQGWRCALWGTERGLSSHSLNLLLNQKLMELDCIALQVCFKLNCMTDKRIPLLFLLRLAKTTKPPEGGFG